MLFRDIQKPPRHPSVGDSVGCSFPKVIVSWPFWPQNPSGFRAQNISPFFFSAMYFSSFGRAKLRGRRFTTDHRCDPNPNACWSTKFAEEYIKGRSVPGTLCYATVTVRQWSE